MHRSTIWKSENAKAELSLPRVFVGMTIPEQLRSTRRPLTVKEAADTLGLHPQTLYKWTRTGRVPVMRIGGALRIDPQALAVWVEDRTVA